MGVVRLRMRWDEQLGKLVEVPLEARTPQRSAYVWNDLPAYDSPIDGRIVDGRKQRREDLRRNNCRPWEGREQEQKQADRNRAENERRLDGLAEKMAHRAWAEAPERVRKVFRGR